jgi:hypothetical protein
MRRRLILGLGLGLTAAFAAVAATAPASDALKGKQTCGPSAWVPREQAPMASHDGRVLAWSTQSTQNRFMRRVFVSTPDGSNVRPVSVPGLGNDEARALAPDGSQVLIERIGDPGRLILASTRAAEARVVTDAEADKLRRLWERAPQWSPDGRFRVDADDEGCSSYRPEVDPRAAFRFPEPMRTTARLGRLTASGSRSAAGRVTRGGPGPTSTSYAPTAQVYGGSRKAAPPEYHSGRRTGRSSHLFSTTQTSKEGRRSAWSGRTAPDGGS